jgi:hypothetical protein
VAVFRPKRDNAEGADGLAVSEQILGKTDHDLSPTLMDDQLRLDDEQALAGHRIVNRIERVGEFEEGIPA